MLLEFLKDKLRQLFITSWDCIKNKFLLTVFCGINMDIFTFMWHFVKLTRMGIFCADQIFSEFWKFGQLCGIFWSLINAVLEEKNWPEYSRKSPKLSWKCPNWPGFCCNIGIDLPDKYLYFYDVHAMLFSQGVHTICLKYQIEKFSSMFIGYDIRLFKVSLFPGWWDSSKLWRWEPYVCTAMELCCFFPYLLHICFLNKSNYYQHLVLCSTQPYTLLNNELDSVGKEEHKWCFYLLDRYIFLRSC